MTLVDRQKLRDNLEYLTRRLEREPDFGKVWPRVETSLVSNVLSRSEFIQYDEHFEFRSDEAAARGGGGSAPSPLRYLLSSLAFCQQGFYAKASAIVDVVIDESDVRVLTYMDMRGEHRVGNVPANPQWMVIEARFSTKSMPENVLAMVDDANARCPVGNLIRKAVPIYEQIYRNGLLIRDTVPGHINANWEWRSPR